MLKRLKIWLLVFPLILISTECDTGGYRIPYVRVDLHLNIISELGNPALTTSILIDGGVNGLIVYRQDFDEFHVYDRTCTMYPEHDVAVEEDSVFTGIFTCPECGSQFLPQDGDIPLGGPAVFGLYEYPSRVDGDLLHVYNY